MSQAQKPQMLTVLQTGSPIAREKKQRQTLIGLGLNKLGRMRQLPDTPEIRGMVAKISHLVEIVATKSNKA